jgi:NAD-dependent dihydropyrimidine dehydrogenase PreA subunit
MSNKQYIDFLTEDAKGTLRATGKIPRFIKERCTGAGICKQVCPADAVLGEPRNRSISIDHDKCTKCGTCIRLCSANALV